MATRKRDEVKINSKISKNKKVIALNAIIISSVKFLLSCLPFDDE